MTEENINEVGQAEKDKDRNNKKSKKTLKIIGIVAGSIFLCLVILVIIGSIIGSTPEGQATSTARAQDEMATESQETVIVAEVMTETAQPTHTHTATEIPSPTFTPEPTLTNTPIPTNTPEPEPVVLTGSGDDVVDFENPFDVAIVKISGNASSRHFAVENYGSDGEKYNLLVNTTDPYEGVVPIDFFQGEHTTRFEVTAMGEWSIEVLPLTEARELSVPGSIEGSGDDVIRLSGSDPDIANIVGNAESRHFAVVGYGNDSDLLVNTTEPYEGRVILDDDTLILEITAHGDWSISIE